MVTVLNSLLAQKGIVYFLQNCRAVLSSLVWSISSWPQDLHARHINEEQQDSIGSKLRLNGLPLNLQRFSRPYNQMCGRSGSDDRRQSWLGWHDF
jgi:hypothetical protein